MTTTEKPPVICPDCGMPLQYVPLSVHRENCPALRYPHTEATGKAVLQGLVRAGRARREGERT